MSKKALGVIEVSSIGVLIQAMDVMLKAAAIDFVNYEKIGSGQVAAYIRADVGACETAIKAGLAFVNETAKARLVTAFVIPEPDEKLERCFPIKMDS